MVIVVVGGLFWLQILRDVSEYTEAEAAQMEEQRQQMRDQLETIEDQAMEKLIAGRGYV